MGGEVRVEIAQEQGLYKGMRWHRNVCVNVRKAKEWKWEWYRAVGRSGGNGSDRPVSV